MERAGILATALAAAAALGGAGPAAAQGSSVSTHSACASARAGAAAAAPCPDGSSIYYNPATLAVMPTVAAAGFTAIDNTGSFTYDSTGTVVEREPAVPFVPHAYGSYRVNERWAAAVGFFAPYGLGIEWPESFEGRFISWKSALEGLYVQPTVAWQAVPGRLAVGAGVDIVRGGIEINRHVDAPIESPQLALLGVPLGTDIARARLEGGGWGVGGQVGIYWTPLDRLALGARYMHQVEIGLSGDADFEPISTGLVLILPDEETGEPTAVPLDDLVAPSFGAGGPLEDQSAEASITLPPQAVVGARFGVRQGVALTADYQWTGWTTFDEILATFENGGQLALALDYLDTHTLRFGADLEARRGLDVRLGFLYNTAASPDESVTPVLPEAERQLYTLGAGYRIGDFQTDVFYNYVRQADRRGRVRSAVLLPASPEELEVGLYSSTAHLFGLTVAYVPGGDR